MFPKTIPPKDEDTGKPITMPRNIYAMSNFKGKVEGHVLGGKGKSTYFEKGKFNAAKPGDVYQDPKKFTLKTKHPEVDPKFRPAKVVAHEKKKNRLGYEMMSDNPEVHGPTAEERAAYLK